MLAFIKWVGVGGGGGGAAMEVGRTRVCCGRDVCEGRGLGGCVREEGKEGRKEGRRANR